MLPTDDAVLCRYHYDPLDRVAGSSPAGAGTVQRFYQKRRLATEVQGPVRRMIFQSEEQLLAQHESGGGRDSSVLLATDQQRSVLHHVDTTQQTARVYTAYGFGAVQVNFPGFNGEHPEPLTGHYLLGNGYRAFNPVLMRFNSPDSMSPFGKGGLNAYAYCVGDPVNWVDPTGHIRAVFRGVLKAMRIMKKAKPVIPSAPIAPLKAARAATNIKVLDDGVYKFDEILGSGKKRITIDAHGSRVGGQEYNLMSAGGKKLTPDHLAYLTEMAGVEFKDYDKVRLLMCNSANQGSRSFAAEFSAIINQPVQGFRSVVSATPDQDTILNLIAQNSNSIRRLSNGNYHYDEGVRMFKGSHLSPGDSLPHFFNFMPRTFESTQL